MYGARESTDASHTTAISTASTKEVLPCRMLS